MNILITAPYNEQDRKVLETTFGQITYRPWKPNGQAYNENELIDLLNESHADALITEHDHVTKKVISSFKELKFIGVCRGTPSNVDMKTASKYGIPVFHTPARNAQAVAEMFLANVITLMRNTLPAIDWLQSESWKAGAHDSYLQFKGNELAGKTIGIVGFGAIGHRIAEIVKNFPCPVLFYDPYVKEYDQEYENASLEGVFLRSDIVSVHLPANKETKNMIGESLLSKMKKDAIFVNTSRAMVVKREDLLNALKNETIKGAVLDVFDSEPPDELDYKLIHLPQVLATPHIAGATHEVEDHHARIMNRNLLNWFKSGKKEEGFVANRQGLDTLTKN
jgi:D-3-phosphoglycerate dehydrogenase